MHLAVEELRGLFGGGFILCVQETQDWPRGEDCSAYELNGWRVKHDAGSRVAFLWQESIIGSSIRGEYISTEHAAGIVVGEVALVNSYLPPDDQERFSAAMRDTDFVRAALRARGPRFSAWCGDWNTELPEIDGIIGPTGKNFKTGPYLDRQLDIIHHLNQIRSQIGSTYISDGPLFTHRAYDDPNRCRILDYVATSIGLRTRSSIANQRQRFVINDGMRDHFPVLTILLASASLQISKSIYVKTMTGWTPSSPCAKRRFGEACDDAILGLDYQEGQA